MDRFVGFLIASFLLVLFGAFASEQLALLFYDAAARLGVTFTASQKLAIELLSLVGAILAIVQWEN